MKEIERKFLVNSEDYKTEAFYKYRITQGFLNTDPERTVRVRLKGDQGVLTVKGMSSEDGLSRFEWETEISSDEAHALLKLCEDGVIDKMRYEVRSGDHVFEIDEFFGANEGLVIAEVELKDEDEHFESPKWIGDEVTGDIRYYNSQISKSPFNTWKDNT
ncbi:CYTH domain-containing protein [Psychroserpens sp.]|uniref:CYTH domain-containing protein n=1 Tax=Psychroserpens sp. TaxID=2020870 RepID=UPI001B12899D|nr:CYTH domain-containing protein [Psychroserpens sp.]MBO6605243.1 CYTH domain-containing protein [Psychroserpens sp.]MBO6630283.1 CYTH domain-containing protein [Psychroserpens sp.]MBO6653948.1 CYTH domain-containing protein [Psychroserpens sp.]MBO6682269.1 CYTH domain-containing protein [Psychroserpens sp.]MBO6748617.1 CYTH domain-containing protein [Psychroserpens sp.]